MPRGTWREWIAPIVAQAIAEARQRGLEGRDFRRHVRAAKPYLCRVTSWGRKVWLSELRIQLGRRPRGRCRPIPPAPGQLVLPLGGGRPRSTGSREALRMNDSSNRRTAAARQCKQCGDVRPVAERSCPRCGGLRSTPVTLALLDQTDSRLDARGKPIDDLDIVRGKAPGCRAGASSSPAPPERPSGASERS